MLGMHAAITCYTEPNFREARLSVPTHFNIREWTAICVTEEDNLTLHLLQFGVPAGFEGPAPTPTFYNHPSAVHHSSDVAAYISKELKEGTMLGPFDHPLFYPWTQTNPLLTRTKKYLHLRHVIMDLFWPLPTGVSVNACTPKESFLGVNKKKHLPSACQRFLRPHQKSWQMLLLVCH